MSEYFRVLNRLWEEKRAPEFPAPRRARVALAPGPAVPAEPRRAPEIPVPAPQLRLLKPTPPPPAPQRQAAPEPGALREMLDALRNLRSKAATRCLVLACASGEDAETFATRVAERAGDSGLRVEVARVSANHDNLPARDRADVDGLYLDINRADWKTRLGAWQATMSSDSVAILVAPRLSASNDAAVIAGACDGLAVLVELGRTKGEELALAIKRARASEAVLLGLVTVGSDGLPPWGRRLLHSLGKFHAHES